MLLMMRKCSKLRGSQAGHRFDDEDAGDSDGGQQGWHRPPELIDGGLVTAFHEETEARQRHGDEVP